MEPYQVTENKTGEIVNGPSAWNDFPRYVGDCDLVKRILWVSVESVKIVGVLPTLNEKA